jgi:hypothetical protein
MLQINFFKKLNKKIMIKFVITKLKSCCDMRYQCMCYGFKVQSNLIICNDHGYKQQILLYFVELNDYCTS